MNIRNMSSSDIEFAAKCTVGEGWLSETRLEFEGFIQHDPSGCFIAEEGQNPVGIGIATSYGAYGFIGELIVCKELRGHGLGQQLLDHMIDYLRRKGAQNILLDGVIPAISLYERVGFEKVCRSLRFVGKPKGTQHPLVRAMMKEDLPRVRQLDLRGFGADRGFFLERRLRLYPELSKVLEKDGKTAGFILGRRGNGLISAGPWIVQSGIDNPEILLRSIASETSNIPMVVGVLETNLKAVELLRSLDFEENPSSPWRMVLGSKARLGISPIVYAIGSAAKG